MFIRVRKMSEEAAFIRRIIEELDAFSSLRPPVFSSILLTQRSYNFLRQHVDHRKLKLIMKELKNIQNFYRSSPPLRLLLFIIYASFILAIIYPLVPSIIFPLLSSVAVAFILLIFLGNLMFTSYMSRARGLLARQTEELKQLSQLLISLYGRNVGVLALFSPDYHGIRVLRRHVSFNPFLTVKFLVVSL